MKDGKDKISKIINSLIEKGYLTREQTRKNGKFINNTITVHESPMPINKASEPCLELPYAENPDTINSDTETPAQYNTKAIQFLVFINNSNKSILWCCS